MSPSRPTVPRRRDVEAAIATYNTAQASLVLLPPEATRLLAVMFPRDSVCQCSHEDLFRHGFGVRALRQLLRALIDAGFLTKD